jgi:hypothetical protein
MSGGHSTNLNINRKLSARLHKHAVSSSYIMAYGEKRKHQYFKVKYQFNYPSGKKWKEERECLCYSEIGVRDTIKWLFKGKDVDILSIEPTGRFAGSPVYPSGHVVGEW